MNNHLFKLGARLAVMQLAVLLGHAAYGVTFTVTPGSISNQYSGLITLQIAGLNTGETVNIQKYIDANANGVVDAGDFLVQSFQLTDGQGTPVLAGVTNINVPGDLNATAGAITAQLCPVSEGLEQRFVAQFIFVLSSPTARFPQTTALLAVTSSASGQTITGNVTCNGTNVPDAIVLLVNPQSGGGSFNPYGGTLANNSGYFTLKLPPGSYQLEAFKYGFITDQTKAAAVTLIAGASVTTNLSLLPATSTISGRLVDAANNGLGLPGMLGKAGNANGLVTLFASNTNGSFSASTTPGLWSCGFEQQDFDLLGYLSLNNNAQADTSTGSVAGVTIAVPKATAVIYGSIKDAQNNPLIGVGLDGQDGNNNNGNGTYQGRGATDQNGNYVVGVVAGTWGVSVDNGNNLPPQYANYIFSQGPSWTFNNGGNGTNLSAGMAARADFSALLATNLITGSLKDGGGNPIPNVDIYANAMISGINYNQSATTDANGNYSMSVASGNWVVVVNCCNSGNCNNALNPNNYNCPNQQNVSIPNGANGNGLAYFVATTGGSYQINGSVTDGNGNGVNNVTVTATANSSTVTTTTGSDGSFSLNVGNGNWVVSLDCSGLGAQGYTCVGSQSVQISNSGNNVYFTVQPCSALQVTTTTLDDGFIGSNYSFQLADSGCHPPFTWSLSPGSSPLPQGLSLSANGVVAGSPGITGTNYFSARVTDAQGTNADGLVSIAIYPGLQITNSTLANGNLGIPYSARIGTTGGSGGFGANVTSGTFPPGLSLSLDGGISGSPTQSGTFQFTVQVNDNSGLDPAQATFTIIISPAVTSLTNIVVTPANPVIGAGTNQQFTATGTFSDGSSRVLTAGGWSEKAPMPVAANSMGAASLNDLLYVDGGNNGSPLATLYGYNPISNIWTNLAAMPGGRYQGDGAAVISNQLYVAGGWTTSPPLPNNNLWVYDPAANSWQTKASLPLLSAHGASVVISNLLYVTTPEDGFNGYYNFLHVYNPGNNSWTALANSPDAHAGAGFGVINNLLYLAGGANSSGVVSNRLDVYNPALNSWTTRSPMPTSRQDPASVVLNGQLWVIGGSDPAGNFLNTVEVYDPTTDVWTTATPMPTARSAAAAAVVSGVIYVVGGGNSSGFLASNEAFTPGDGLTWSSSAPLVATIGTNGLALGVSAGAATITASSSGASGSSLLTVVVAPTIANPPLSETSAPDGSVTLSVGASGGDLSYQWEFNGTNIAGATGATLILTNLSASQAGVYTVTVSNVAGSRTSAGANVAALNLQMFAGVILDGPIGARYSVQSTPVLGPANWITVTNIIVTTQPYIYIDYSSITNSQQFYRAVPLP